MTGESNPASFEPEPQPEPDVRVEFAVTPPEGEELGGVTIVSDDYGTAMLLTKRGQAEYGRAFDGPAEGTERAGEAPTEGDDEQEA